MSQKILKLPASTSSMMRLAKLLILLPLLWCCGCRAPEDRTGKIGWQSVWGTDDPAQKIVEKYDHSPNRARVLRPPVIAQDGTVYLLRPHEYTEPKGPSLVAAGPARQWEFRVDGGICTSPAVADDGTILFGTHAGAAGAVSPEGQKKWTYAFPSGSYQPAVDFGGGGIEPPRSPACSQPAVAAEGTSYWVGRGVYALSKEGVLQWGAEPGEDFVFVCVAADGTIYALANGGIFAIGPDGTARWKFPFAKSKYFAGAVALAADGTVCLTTLTEGETSLTFLTPQGALKRRYREDTGSLVIGKTLIGADGTVYVTKNIMNRTYAMVLEADGRENWTGHQESETWALASDGTLYIRDVIEIVALDSHRKILWKGSLPENPERTEYHEPTDAVTLGPDGKFYIGDFEGRLGVLDTSAGIANAGWPAPFHDARNTSRAGAR